MIEDTEKRRRAMVLHEARRQADADRAKMIRDGVSPNPATADDYFNPANPNRVVANDAEMWGRFRCFTSWCRPGRRCSLCKHKR